MAFRNEIKEEKKKSSVARRFKVKQSQAKNLNSAYELHARSSDTQTPAESKFKGKSKETRGKKYGFIYHPFNAMGFVLGSISALCINSQNE